MTIKPEEITASLRRMADVETSVLYSQRTTLIVAAAEIERLQAENTALRQQLAGSDETTLLRYLADIRQKSGVGMKPMLSELADAIAERIAEARNKALDEACELVATITRDELKDSEGVSPPDYFDEGTSAAYEAIRALKDSAP